MQPKKIIIVIAVIVVIAIVCTVLVVPLIFKKTPYEQLIELREITFDVNGEYAQKLKNPNLSKVKKEEIKKERTQKIKDMRKDLGVFPVDDKGNFINQSQFEYLCKLTKDDIICYIEKYSVEDFVLLVREAGINKEILLWLVEIFPEHFVVFDFDNTQENHHTGYYAENKGAEPFDKKMPVENNDKLFDSYTAKYYGDFAVQYEETNEYSDGSLGWQDGTFVDQAGGYYQRHQISLYYKGEYLCLVFSQEGNRSPTIDDRRYPFYLYTFETPQTVYPLSNTVYKGFYLWRPESGELNIHGWGEIK